MESYLFKVFLVQSVLFLLYAFFKNDRSFQMKRYYLLFVLLFSFTVPLTENIFASTETEYFSVMLEPINYAIDNSVSAVEETQNVDLLQFLFFTGLGISFIVLMIKIVSVIRLYLTAESKHVKEGCIIINHSNLKSDFSFFNWIFLKEKQNDQEIVFLHELVHVKQLHSIDILLFEINKCLFWFNPLSYWISSELKLNHEFIADQTILKSCDMNSYKEMLLANAFQTKGTIIGSTFSFSKLKNRFTMMNNQKAQKFSWKIILTIPVIALVTMSFTMAKSPIKTSEIIPIKTTESSPIVGEPDVAAEYPGGMEEMSKFIGANLKYPESAYKAKLSGLVVVGFTIDTDGTVKDASVKKGFHADCDAEALRVVKSMPKWKPASKGGKTVATEMNLPIKFAL